MRLRVCLCVLLQVAAVAHARLQAGDLLLLTDSHVPQSLALAKHYAEVRHVPLDRIFPLDVAAADDVPLAQYDAKIAAPLRAYLKTPAGRGVRCLVLFYGLPLRVGPSEATPADHAEIASLRKLLAELDRATPPLADAAESIATSLGLKVQALAGNGTPIARARVEAAARQIQQALATMPDRAKQMEILQRLQDIRTRMTAVAEGALETAFPGSAALSDADPTKLPELMQRPHDAGARSTVRRRVASFDGAFALYDIAQQQIAWIDADESDASLDSELSLVLTGDYPRFRWQRNLLNYKVQDQQTQALMTCRIDAPTPQIAKAVIDDSFAVEQTGLSGGAVFDSRGIAAPPAGSLAGYGWYDQAIRDTAKWFEDTTSLTVTHDDKPQVIAPHSVKDVALYCGWYSLRNYVPACTFNRGAVGYHVASFELISLHAPAEKGWVANLLKDHVVATLGPVSEPYLLAFPRPDEFFPLLLTGKLTLAEVYWKTCPLASWKMTLIGDPLYRPYAQSPAIRVDQLPSTLASAIDKN